MKEFKAESKRLMELMINSIYTNKEIFLRELISNASDAIDKLHFLSLTDSGVKSDFSILVGINKEARTITISDSGCGMTAEELEKNLGTIATSGTLAFKKEQKSDESLIGQFGVGFYSAFMVADKVTVTSKAYKCDEANVWESAGADGYTINSGFKMELGTDVVLHIKADDEECDYSKFLEQYFIEELIKKYSDYIRHPIRMLKEKIKDIDLDESVVEDAENKDNTENKEEKTDKKKEKKTETTFELETLNSMTPIWKKQKSQVKEEELNSFYSDKFHDYMPPLKYFMSSIEGNVNYNTLLFVPKKPPFDYYSKDFQKGLMLHSNGVLIMEKCADLLPDYLGFIRGVVDSGDLSLNISREMLQQDRQLKAIANSLEKKIVSELEKWQKTERESFEEMFASFGTSLKLGIYDNYGQRKDMLKDVIMYNSSASDKMTTLKEYVSRLKENQTVIYYASGDSIKKIKAMPQTEKLLKDGMEILFLTDRIDEFVIKVLDEYDGKKFKSVADKDIAVSDEDKKTQEKAADDNKDMLGKMKEHLAGKVMDVRFTTRLSSHAVCLTSDNEISLEMEKVLNTMQNNGMGMKAAKALEINVNHPIVAVLKGMEADKEKFDSLTDVLYNSALVIEGMELENPSGFVDKIISFIK